MEHKKIKLECAQCKEALVRPKAGLDIDVIQMQWSGFCPVHAALVEQEILEGRARQRRAEIALMQRYIKPMVATEEFERRGIKIKIKVQREVALVAASWAMAFNISAVVEFPDDKKAGLPLEPGWHDFYPMPRGLRLVVRDGTRTIEIYQDVQGPADGGDDLPLSGLGVFEDDLEATVNPVELLDAIRETAAQLVDFVLNSDAHEESLDCVRDVIDADLDQDEEGDEDSKESKDVVEETKVIGRENGKSRTSMGVRVWPARFERVWPARFEPAVYSPRRTPSPPLSPTPTPTPMATKKRRRPILAESEVACRYFAQGTCRFSGRCRYKHDVRFEYKIS